tara:strand:- start:717 stop:1247 length:531 start_codon:yes stop_codon:yes gene_type:complete
LISDIPSARGHSPSCVSGSSSAVARRPSLVVASSVASARVIARTTASTRASIRSRVARPRVFSRRAHAANIVVRSIDVPIDASFDDDGVYAIRFGAPSSSTRRRRRRRARGRRRRRARGRRSRGAMAIRCGADAAPTRDLGACRANSEDTVWFGHSVRGGTRGKYLHLRLHQYRPP